MLAQAPRAPADESVRIGTAGACHRQHFAGPRTGGLPVHRGGRQPPRHNGCTRNPAPMALSAAARWSLDEAPAEAPVPTGAVAQAGPLALDDPLLDLAPEAVRTDVDPAAAASAPAAEEASVAQAPPSEVARLIADRDRLLSQVATQLAERARVAAALAAEVDRLRGILEVTEETCGRLAADLERARPAAARVEELEGSLAAAMEERDRLIAALERAEAAGAEKEARAATAAQAQARDALSQAENVIAALEEQLAASRAEVERLEANARETQAERTRLEGLLADAERRASQAQARATDLEAEAARRAAPPAPEAPKTAGAAAAAAPPVPTAVVLDVDAGWEADAPADTRVTVVDPARADLAAPGAAQALVALRAADPALRLRGCLAPPDGGRVLMLGAIEVAAHPLDPARISAALAPHATRGTKVLTAGTHADDFMALRQALIQAGMVVSMVWDSKQADDLLEMVRPAIVVVDLAMPRRDGYALLARLAALAPVPTVLLVADDATTHQAFAAPLADPAVLQQARPRARALADLLAPAARAKAAAPR